MLNLYLRYFDLKRTSDVVGRLRMALEDAPIDFENVYLVAGDFTGLVDGDSEIEATMTTKGAKTNGDSNGRMKWCVNGDDQVAVRDDEAQTQNGNDSISSVEDILNDFQYTQLFEANTTPFVDLAHAQEIDDGLNMSHAPPKNIKKSSCNILCRDKLPSVTDPFKEAIYKSKSPMDLRKVPSAKDSLKSQRSWRTEKLTGHCNVIREGLCHMAIPRDWTWGGPASDHCPVWVECYKRVEKTTVPVLNGITRKVGMAGVTSLSEAMNGVALVAQNGGTPAAPVMMMTNGTARKRLSSSNGGGSLDENVLRSPVQ